MQAQEVTPIPPIASCADFVQVHFKKLESPLYHSQITLLHTTFHMMTDYFYSITLITVRAQHLIYMHRDTVQWIIEYLGLQRTVQESY